MAISTDSSFIQRDIPEVCNVIQVSTLDAGVDVNQAHTGPSGARAYKVDHTVITKPTDGSDVKFEWDGANDSTTNNTIRIRFDTEAGGSLTGAVVKLFVYFGGVASGGIS
jgi:hypothetical protein